MLFLEEKKHHKVDACGGFLGKCGAKIAAETVVSNGEYRFLDMVILADVLGLRVSRSAVCAFLRGAHRPAERPDWLCANGGVGSQWVEWLS